MTIQGEALPTLLGFGRLGRVQGPGQACHGHGGPVAAGSGSQPGDLGPGAKRRLEVTALHNHFFYEQPGSCSCTSRHGAQGKPGPGPAPGPGSDRHAQAAPTPAASPPPLNLDTKALEKIIGHPGRPPRGVQDHGGPSGGQDDGRGAHLRMGLNSWAAFVGTPEKGPRGRGYRHEPQKGNPVIQALRTGSIEVVACA